MKLNRIVFLFALTLSGMIGQAFAGTVDTGTLNYSFTGITPDSSCSGLHQRENFTGTVTDSYESLSNAALSFSLCNIPASYAGAVFTLTLDANDVISGTIAATETDVITSGIDHATATGSFLVTSGTGVFAGGVGNTGSFSAVTQETLMTGAGSGTFTLTTPEPATTVLMGLGILALGLANFRRRGTHLTLRA
jgi:hypothetical protein